MLSMTFDNRPIDKCKNLSAIEGNHDSSVGIATGHGLDGGGSIPGKGKGFFLSPKSPDQFQGPLSPMKWVQRDLTS
jgi:hypothetical protein